MENLAVYRRRLEQAGQPPVATPTASADALPASGTEKD
jgi:hypothetical protein